MFNNTDFEKEIDQLYTVAEQAVQSFEHYNTIYGPSPIARQLKSLK